MVDLNMVGYKSTMEMVAINLSLVTVRLTASYATSGETLPGTPAVDAPRSVGNPTDSAERTSPHRTPV